jgi:hypothetical protein
MLNWVFGNIIKKKRKRRRSEKRPKGKKPPYEDAKKIAAKGSVEERRNLASHENLEPEILYYFTDDEAPEVRREVANNPGAPLQADLILAKDENDEVRMELARKSANWCLICLVNKINAWLKWHWKFWRSLPKINYPWSEQSSQMNLNIPKMCPKQ